MNLLKMKPDWRRKFHDAATLKWTLSLYLKLESMKKRQEFKGSSKEWLKIGHQMIMVKKKCLQMGKYNAQA
ncbi:hypothetical protein ACHQM5_017944 [Ranunculus cassubicifolius]